MLVKKFEMANMTKIPSFRRLTEAIWRKPFLASWLIGMHPQQLPVDSSMSLDKPETDSERSSPAAVAEAEAEIATASEVLTLSDPILLLARK